MARLEFRVGKQEIRTRRCTLRDHDFVLKIVKESIWIYVSKYYKPSRQMFDDRFRKDFKERTILLRGVRRIGFFQLTPDKDDLHITGIFLTPNYRGKGIGKYLMDYFEMLGHKRILLQVWENNPAHEFYLKIGYKDIKLENHKYLMEKKIKRK
jgi:ribosomal protein S18 acetylase RimI-like enzyme